MLKCSLIIYKILIGVIKCPFCWEPLSTPLVSMPEAAKKEYEAYLNRNGAFKIKWRRRIEKASVRERPRTPDRPHNINERLDFCQVHQVETVHKQEALKKGYPMDIDFKALPKRILSFQDSLINIAKGTLDSLFLKAEKEFIDENGLIKSRSIFGQFSRFHRASVIIYFEVIL